MKNYRTNKISHWEQQFYTVQWTGDPTPSSLNILPNKTIKQLIVELGKLTTLSDYKHFNVKIQHLNPTTESFYLYKCTADLTDFTGFSSFSTLQKKIHVQFCQTVQQQKINRSSIERQQFINTPNHQQSTNLAIELYWFDWKNNNNNLNVLPRIVCYVKTRTVVKHHFHSFF